MFILTCVYFTIVLLMVCLRILGYSCKQDEDLDGHLLIIYIKYGSIKVEYDKIKRLDDYLTYYVDYSTWVNRMYGKREAISPVGIPCVCCRKLKFGFEYSCDIY